MNRYLEAAREIVRDTFGDKSFFEVIETIIILPLGLILCTLAKFTEKIVEFGERASSLIKKRKTDVDYAGLLVGIMIIGAGICILIVAQAQFHYKILGLGIVIASALGPLHGYVKSRMRE